MNIDVNIIDTIDAYSIGEGDQILVDGDPIEVRSVEETGDPNEIRVRGYSHETGDMVTYPLYAFDTFELWAL